MKKPRALERLLRDLDLREVSRRTGISQKKLRGASFSEREAAEIQAAERRREAAIRAAETRKAHRTRIPEDVRKSFTPSELAERLGRPERQVKKWVTRGGAPKDVLDAAAELSEGRARPYPLDWEHGRGRAVPREIYGDLSSKLWAFSEAVRGGNADEIKTAFRAWRRVKIPARRSMSRETWSRTIEEIAQKLGIPDVGTFSAERFKRS